MCSHFLAMVRTIYQVAGVPKAYPAGEKSEMFEVNGVIHKAIEMNWKVGWGCVKSSQPSWDVAAWRGVNISYLSRKAYSLHIQHFSCYNAFSYN
jgi:hypothetical protein